jgi:5-methylcytosine-specific restriction endonuclease McrA
MSKEWKQSHPHKNRASNTVAKHLSQGIKKLIPTFYIEKLFEETIHCSICGCELKRDMGGHSPRSPSLDRIDNEDELRYDNIWIVCYKCNTRKSNNTMKEFYDYCKGVVEKFKPEFEGE